MVVARIVAATPARLAQLFDRKMGRILLLLSRFHSDLNIPAGRPALPIQQAVSLADEQRRRSAEFSLRLSNQLL
jgi:hypothetical protein